MSLRQRRIVWFIALSIWTISLLLPMSWFRSALPKQPTTMFGLSKFLHLSAYAGLAATVPWLLPRRAWLWLVMLSLHTVATELLQTLTSDRTGSVVDVVIDHVGLLIGVLVGWTLFFRLRA